MVGEKHLVAIYGTPQFDRKIGNCKNLLSSIKAETSKNAMIIEQLLIQYNTVKPKTFKTESIG